MFVWILIKITRDYMYGEDPPEIEYFGYTQDYNVYLKWCRQTVQGIEYTGNKLKEIKEI
jgi:hypothetical protein